MALDKHQGIETASQLSLGVSVGAVAAAMLSPPFLMTGLAGGPTRA